MDTLYSTIYHQPWWLDIVSKGHAREVTVLSGGLVVGRLPYLPLQGRFGITGIGMPRMTHVLGPSMAPQFSGDNFPRSLKQMSILDELIQQLPPTDYTRFRLHGGLSNTLAFETAGFIATAEYTVEIDPCPPEVSWKQLRDKTRNVIRRAQEVLTLCELSDATIDSARFSAFYEGNLLEKQLRSDYDSSLVRRLVQETMLRNSGRILAAVDAAGDIQAAVFTIWDHHSEYYFMSTRRPAAHNGAVSMLVWEAIQHAARLNLRFDMDGLHVKRGEVPNLLLCTGFGGRLSPRYLVTRTSRSVQLAQWAKQSVTYLRTVRTRKVQRAR